MCFRMIDICHEGIHAWVTKSKNLMDETKTLKHTSTLKRAWESCH